MGVAAKNQKKDREESRRQRRGKEANEAAWMCQARGMRDWKVCEFCCVCTHGIGLQCNFQGTLEKKLAKGPLISNHLVFVVVAAVVVMEAVFFTYEQKHVSNSTFG